MAHFSLNACPLCRDAVPYLFLQCPSGRHCTSLSDPTGQLALCTSFVSFPFDSSQHIHSNTSASVAVCQPLTVFALALTNPSKLSATRRLRCWPAVLANAARTWRMRSLSVLSMMTAGASVVRGTGGARHPSCRLSPNPGMPVVRPRIWFRNYSDKITNSYGCMLLYSLYEHVSVYERIFCVWTYFLCMDVFLCRWCSRRTRTRTT